jgi:DNA sulfur modification protein DndD
MDDSSEIKIKRLWNKEKKGGKIVDTLHVWKDGQNDTYLSQNWNYYVEEILPLGIARFFFFDNEKISQIADDDSFEQIKESIKSIIGIATIDKLIEDMKRLIKNKSSIIRSEENLQLKHEQEENELQIEELERDIIAKSFDIAHIKPKLEKNIADLEIAEQNFWKQGGLLGLNKDEIEKQREKLQAKDNELKQQILDFSVSAATPLALCKNLVIDAYNEYKNNEEHLARQYSEPLLSCIYERIVQKFKQVFSEESIYEALLEIIDTEFSDYRSNQSISPVVSLRPTTIMLFEKLINGGFDEIYNKRAYFSKTTMENENALLQIDVHLNNNAEQNGALELYNTIKELEAAKAENTLRLQNLKSRIDNLKQQKEFLERKRYQIIKKMVEYESEIADDAKIIRYAAITIEIMQEYKLRLQQAKVHKLETNITRCFKYLAQKEGMVSSVKINPDTLNITLLDYAGGELLKSQLSAGEKQMFAISILWGLALSSGYQLPVVIDTPMARLDSAHRNNFINRYLPNASTQVIVLSTDEEFYGKYLEYIRPYVNTFYTLVYDDSGQCSFIVPGYFEEGT